jgi:hypothetical protein
MLARAMYRVMDSEQPIGGAALPLKAVVLDNDETTGSYGLLFALVVVFRQEPIMTNIRFKRLLKNLAIWMLTNGLFRPGIQNLLYTITALRRRGLIDKIIMYTNQTENPYSNLYLESVPYCIGYMMNCISKQTVFDFILAKDAFSSLAAQYTPKTFDRVLDLFPNKPRDIRGIIFVDDLASPEHIHSYTIAPHLQTTDCWYSIAPYYKNLSKQDVYNCLKFVLFTNILADMYIESVWEVYQRYIPRGETSEPTAMPMLHLCDTIEQKFGSVL